MHRTLIASSLAAAVAHAQPVLYPANDHYYEAIPGTMSWENARSAAAAREYQGWPGHLASFTTPEESAFVISALGGLAVRGYHIGAFQNATCAGQAQGWHWITQEPWSW